MLAAGKSFRIIKGIRKVFTTGIGISKRVELT
jgi:hypothetical protein